MSRRALWTWADYERSARAEEARARAREAEGAQAPVACAAAAHDGLVSGALDVSSLDWAPAVRDPRPVAPAAGPSPRAGREPAAAVPVVSDAARFARARDLLGMGVPRALLPRVVRLPPELWARLDQAHG